MTFGLHLATAHSSSRYNDDNPGLYLRLENGFTAGSYYNSARKQSSYIGVTLPVLQGAFDVSAVVLTGYRIDPLPAIVPSKRMSLTDRFDARISLLMPPNAASVIHISLERTFK